jgi:hypothetical protein
MVVKNIGAARVIANPMPGGNCLEYAEISPPFAQNLLN